MFKRLDLAIINRSFWPVYPVIGEALMRFAEQQAKTQKVGVILQNHADIRAQLLKHQRGEQVGFYPAYAFSVSGSSILRRAMDAVFFMLWVFLVLLIKRPRKVYVSTDPPVLVPFIVMLYCAIFRAQYVYHLQDIHPEAANVVIPVKPWLFRILRWLDSVTMRRANLLITITQEMADQLRFRSGTQSSIAVLANPSVSFDQVKLPEHKTLGFTFCGNAGRLQRIPLLIQAIERYCQQGGTLPFVFAGAGVYAADLEKLAQQHSNVTYKGLVSASDAAQLNADYTWALLPIEDEVTRYAFPSKSSSYVFSGALIAAVCGNETSVAKWVTDNRLGVVVAPEVDAVCQFFFNVERGQYDAEAFNYERGELKQSLGFDAFLQKLTGVVIDMDGRKND
ncbi:putative glycosyl transferase [Ectopseudomonas oleovorans]|uniref:Putative glycosyl transferase n=1 Tax=Ectopseudomonas oleovorans TaxID=301 RepID=A0A379K4Y8_ECTOL|nr:glycosyltransferase [Pseudomonas oleovorans]SUD59728.1 putative glycosyl transferase [Pseudomonas oleovorans]